MQQEMAASADFAEHNPVRAKAQRGLEQILEGDMVRNYRAMLLPLVVLLMMTLGVIAAIGPLRQGLRIQPIEALRDE